MVENKMEIFSVVALITSALGSCPIWKGERLWCWNIFMDCRELFAIITCRTYLNGSTLKWFTCGSKAGCYSCFTCGRLYEVDLGRSHRTLLTAQPHNIREAAMEEASCFCTIASQGLGSVLPLRRDFQAWTFVVRCSSGLLNAGPMSWTESQRLSCPPVSPTHLWIMEHHRASP